MFVVHEDPAERIVSRFPKEEISRPHLQGCNVSSTMILVGLLSSNPYIVSLGWNHGKAIHE